MIGSGESGSAPRRVKCIQRWRRARSERPWEEYDLTAVSAIVEAPFQTIRAPFCLGYLRDCARTSDEWATTDVILCPFHIKVLGCLGRSAHCGRSWVALPFAASTREGGRS